MLVMRTLALTLSLLLFSLASVSSEGSVVGLEAQHTASAHVSCGASASLLLSSSSATADSITVRLLVRSDQPAKGGERFHISVRRADEAAFWGSGDPPPITASLVRELALAFSSFFSPSFSVCTIGFEMKSHEGYESDSERIQTWQLPHT